MARPSLLTRARHERIVELLEDGLPFATACRRVGVSASAGYEWLYRGWGTHPHRPPAPRYIAFAEAVDAVFPGGFAERHEDEFVDAQNNEGTETGFPQFPQPNTGFAENAEPGFFDIRDRARAREHEAEQENPRASGGFAERSVSPVSPVGYARTREQEPEADAERSHREEEPSERAWLSQKSRKEASILDEVF